VRIIGVVAQGFAQTVNCFIEPTVEVDYGIRWPKAFLEFFACQDLTWALDERH
jgi:hypothetical protein